MGKSLIRAAGVGGALLGAASLGTAAAFPARHLLNGGLCLLSLALLLVFFIGHFEAFRGFSRKRSTQLGANSLLMVALFLFIMVMINLLARQYYLMIDLSASANYTLGAQSRKVAREIPGELRITAFVQEGKGSARKAEQLLEGYRYLNRNLVYSVLDLDAAPGLAKEYGVTGYDTVVVKGEGAPVVAKGISEESITGALIKATRRVHKKIYFLTGHGERDLHDAGRDGISQAAARLQALGYDCAPLFLSDLPAVPSDASLVLLAGPRKPLAPEETGKLTRYLAGGGRELLLFDPGYDPSAMVGAMGIDVQRGEVSDPGASLNARDDKTPLVASYPETPVTRDFRQSTVYPGAASLLLGQKRPGYDTAPLALTSPESMVIADGKPVAKGSQVIAALAGSKNGKDAMVVFGDSDFAANAFFDVMGNGELFLNCVNWLAGEEGLIAATPKREEFTPLYLTAGQGMFLFYLCVIAVPALVFGAGLSVWLGRRRL